MADNRESFMSGNFQGPSEAPSDEKMVVVIDTVAKQRFEVPSSEAWAYGSDAARFLPTEYSTFAGQAVLPQRVIDGVEA